MGVRDDVEDIGDIGGIGGIGGVKHLHRIPGFDTEDYRANA